PHPPKASVIPHPSSEHRAESTDDAPASGLSFPYRLESSVSLQLLSITGVYTHNQVVGEMAIFQQLPTIRRRIPLIRPAVSGHLEVRVQVLAELCGTTPRKT